MARPTSKDPLDKFRWSVEIEGFRHAGFTSVEAPGISFSTTEYVEGGAHLTPRQIIDTASYKPVTLSRGVIGDGSFLRWVLDVLELTQPVSTKVNNNKGNQNTDTEVINYRRDVVIRHLDRAGRTRLTYTLVNAIPVEYEPASDFGADQDDTYSMEKLVLKYESFDVKIEGQSNDPFDLSGISKRLLGRI